MNVSIGPHVEKFFASADFGRGAATAIATRFERDYSHCYEEEKGCTWDPTEEETECACACSRCRNLREMEAECESVRAQIERSRETSLK